MSVRAGAAYRVFAGPWGGGGRREEGELFWSGLDACAFKIGQ
jgi:hypothetical protein